jgi:hypothetical protein
MNIHAIGWGMTAFILVLGAVVTELQPLALLLSILSGLAVTLITW